ncbi:MAG: hypothetical protein SW833_11310 [Cyanobacteriota bacterium]|nr:hypothetical protein [Cyanobacteriota bacterium]
MASMDKLLAQLQNEFAQKSREKNSDFNASSKLSKDGGLDDLLAGIKTEFEQNNVAPKTSPSPAMSQDSSSLDDLISQVQGELKPQKPSQPPADSGIDKLLAEVKSEINPRPASDKKTESNTDDLLAQVKSNYNGKNKTANQDKTSPTDNLLAEVKAEFDNKKTVARSPKSSFPGKSTASSPHPTSERTDNLLAELKSEFKKQNIEEDLQQTEKAQREIMQAEKERQQRRKALTRKAEMWLKGLDAYSDEGLWFEEFAYSYSSRLEAAIDYLEALT